MIPRGGWEGVNGTWLDLGSMAAPMLLPPPPRGGGEEVGSDNPRTEVEEGLNKADPWR